MNPDKIHLVQTDPGITPDIVAQILGPIENLLRDSVDQDYEAERILQLLRLQKADNYDRGIQNIAPALDDNGVVRLTTFGVQTPGVNQYSDSRALDYNPRKTRSYRDKFVAVLGQRPFYNTSAEAKDPTNENDRRGARQVNLLIQKLHNEWDLKTLNNRLFFFLFKHGTTLGQVRPVTDGKRFGMYKVPDIRLVDEQLHPGGHICVNCGGAVEGSGPDQQVTCPDCGSPLGPTDYQPPLTTPVPVENGPPKEYPNTSVEATLLNGYFWAVPFDVAPEGPGLMGGAPWVGIECEKHKGIIMRDYPNARDIVGNTSGAVLGGTAADATGAVVRSASQSQLGAVRAQRSNLWAERTNYLDPAMFELLTDETIRGVVKKYFPDGMKTIRVEDQVIELHHQDLKERLNACQPSMSDYLFADGISWGLFGMDDFWTNLLNIAADTFESGIARYLLNPDFFNVDAMNTLRYSPTRYIAAAPKGNGEGFSNAFNIMPTADFPAQVAPFMQVIDEVIQNITGLLPQVFGDMPAGLTLGQARMMLNQGLMQLGTVADNATQFYEDLDTNAVNLFIKVANANPSFAGETIDLDLIRNSQWTIKGGTVMPRTFAERQQELLQMLEQNPQLAAQLKVMDPVNFEALTNYLDLPDLKNPDLDTAEAINDIIDQLWSGQPIQSPPPPPDPMTGQQGPPPPPQPSISFDPLVMDPNIAVSLARYALVQRSGQQRITTPGYQNVRAFLQQAMQAASPGPPPMPQPKLSMSLALDKVPSEQELAVLQKYGISVPPQSGPSYEAINKMDVATHDHAIHGPDNLAMGGNPGVPGGGPVPPPGGPPSQSANPNQPAPGPPALGPGAPSMMPPGMPTGVLQ